MHRAAEFFEQLHEFVVFAHERVAVWLAPLGVGHEIADSRRRAYQHMFKL